MQRTAAAANAAPWNSSPYSLCPLFSENLRYIKFKNLDEIAITTNVYLYKHYKKTKFYVAMFHTSLNWLLEAKRGQ